MSFSYQQVTGEVSLGVLQRHVLGNLHREAAGRLARQCLGTNRRMYCGVVSAFVIAGGRWKTSTELLTHVMTLEMSAKFIQLSEPFAARRADMRVTAVFYAMALKRVRM